MPDFLLVYCSCPDTASAEQLAHYLVSNQLSACVNIIPLCSRSIAGKAE